ncbi:TPA: hypothetical protein N0F65_006852, partial [Lagenidium giganteum]
DPNSSNAHGTCQVRHITSSSSTIFTSRSLAARTAHVRPTLDMYYQPQSDHQLYDSTHPGPYLPMQPSHSLQAHAEDSSLTYANPCHQPVMTPSASMYGPGMHTHEHVHPHAHVPTTSLKRKMPGHYNSVPLPGHGGMITTQSSEKLCDLCQYPDPILFASKCGHRFHSRCVHIWPLPQCPVCDIPINHVSLLKMDMNVQIDTRSGKWTKPEEKFIDTILKEFDRNCMPLAHGTPVRLVLAKLLNCSTMRLSKKFQKNALGKRTFRIPKVPKGTTAMQFDRADHVRRQEEFSYMEGLFRHELVEQFRRENNTDEGAYVEADNLRRAVKQFWVANFLKFAVIVGQPVKGLDVSDSKKRKHALQMMRDGHFDELLRWNTSPVSSPTVSPLPGASTSAPTRPWEPPYLSSTSPVSNENHPLQANKKMRTPENMPMHHSGSSRTSDMDPAFASAPHLAASYGYDKMASSYLSTRANYTSQAFPQASTPAYSSSYPSTKPSPSGHLPQHTPTGYHSHHTPMHYSHDYNSQTPHQTHPQLRGASRHPQEDLQSSSQYPNAMLNPLPYRSNSSYESSPEAKPEQQQHASNPNAPCPWDELLDDISESNPQVVDPALQAWSNLHIM